MLISILFGIFLIIMAIGTYYQIKTYKRSYELHTLQMKNEGLREKILLIDIETNQVQLDHIKRLEAEDAQYVQ